MNVIGTSTVLIQTACTNDNRDTNTAKLFCQEKVIRLINLVGTTKSLNSTST